MSVLIDLENRLVHLSDGQTLCVEHWFDGQGFECEPNEALSLTAGPDANGMWWSLSILPEMATGTIH